MDLFLESSVLKLVKDAWFELLKAMVGSLSATCPGDWDRF